VDREVSAISIKSLGLSHLCLISILRAQVARGAKDAPNPSAAPTKVLLTAEMENVCKSSKLQNKPSSKPKNSNLKENQSYNKPIKIKK
jgi:hypothetical protein